MPHDWKHTTLVGEAEALRVFTELRGRRWLFRGQPKPYGSLVASIDREHETASRGPTSSRLSAEPLICFDRPPDSSRTRESKELWLTMLLP